MSSVYLVIRTRMCYQTRQLLSSAQHSSSITYLLTPIYQLYQSRSCPIYQEENSSHPSSALPIVTSESEYSVCLNKAEGEATDDTEGQTLFADADSDTPVCTVDYGFDDCIGRTKVRSLSNLGTSGTDRDTPLCNTPYELIENGFRCRPPLPPLLNTSSSGMLKRISNAAAKYGQALNLNLNLNLNLSRLNCQTGESRSLNLSPNSSTAYRGWSDDKYESSGHTSRSGRSDAPDFSGRTSTEISRQSSLLDIDGDGAEIHDCDASNVKLSKRMPSSTKPSAVAPAKCATQTTPRPWTNWIVVIHCDDGEECFLNDVLSPTRDSLWL